MRRIIQLVLGIAVWFVFCGLTTTGGVTVNTVTLTSTTTPQSLLPPGKCSQTWSIGVRQSGGNCGGAILVFPYQGSVPGSAPADVREIACGTSFPDQVTNPNGGGNVGISVGYAAVLESGTNTVVDSICR